MEEYGLLGCLLWLPAILRLVEDLVGGFGFVAVLKGKNEGSGAAHYSGLNRHEHAPQLNFQIQW
jgi:hypothetical protein